MFGNSERATYNPMETCEKCGGLFWAGERHVCKEYKAIGMGDLFVHEQCFASIDLARSFLESKAREMFVESGEKIPLFKWAFKPWDLVPPKRTYYLQAKYPSGALVTIGKVWPCYP